MVSFYNIHGASMNAPICLNCMSANENKVCNCVHYIDFASNLVLHDPIPFIINPRFFY